MDRHRIPFSYEGPQDDRAIELVGQVWSYHFKNIDRMHEAILCTCT